MFCLFCGFIAMLPTSSNTTCREGDQTLASPLASVQFKLAVLVVVVAF